MTPHEKVRLERCRSAVRDATGMIWMCWIIMLAGISMALGPALVGPLSFAPSILLLAMGSLTIFAMIIVIYQLHALRRDALERIEELTKNGATP